jgi:hypothetical protein
MHGFASLIFKHASMLLMIHQLGHTHQSNIREEVVALPLINATEPLGIFIYGNVSA